MHSSEQIATSNTSKSSSDIAQINQNSALRYENVLTSGSLLEVLASQSASPIEARLVQELPKGLNLLVEFPRDGLQGGARGVLISLANTLQAKSGQTKSGQAKRTKGSQETPQKLTGGPPLIVVPTSNDIDRLLGSCSELPLDISVFEPKALAIPSTTALRVSSVDQAGENSIIIMSFDQMSGSKPVGDVESLGNCKSIVFLGFSSGGKLPGSDEFENFLGKFKDNQICFCTEAVPLTLNAAVNRHIKTDGFIHINLEKEQEVKLSHEYYEVGHELLAKPEALATVLESACSNQSDARAIIFCNSPSDTDLLEVILKKKGLKAKKLIGNVPDRAIHSTMERVLSGEISILVLTDVSGRGFPVEDFDIIVHYSTPEDPEIYLHRLGQPDGSSRLNRVISLVGSLDLGNFHFLKKVVEFEFKHCSLPSASELAQARFARFEAEAKQFATSDKELLEYSELIKKSDSRDAFILYLLHQTLRRLTEVESQAQKASGGRGGNQRRRDDYGEEREEGGSSHRGGGERHQRDSRSSGQGPGRERMERKERPQPKPTRKDIRFYVGHGTANGMNDDKFVDLVKNALGDEAPELKRSCLRDSYSFFDFEQSQADKVFNALKDGEYNGAPLVLQKAAILSVPLNDDESDDEGFVGEDSLSGHSSNGEHSLSSSSDKDDAFEGEDESESRSSRTRRGSHSEEE